MKKVIVPLFLLLIAACFLAIPCSAKSKAKHVVLIGLDGWGAYSVPKADIPYQTVNGRGFLYFGKTFCITLFQCCKLGIYVYGCRT